MSDQREDHMTRAEFREFKGGLRDRLDAIEKSVAVIDGRAWQVWLAIASALLAIATAALKGGTP